MQGASIRGILEALFQSGNWGQLNKQIIDFSKDRTNSSKAVARMVNCAIEFIDVGRIPDLEIRTKLIKTLISVCERKKYDELEVESVTLVQMLAEIKEQQGLIAEAANLMRELPVEYFVKLRDFEKDAFLVEGVRLCLEMQDIDGATILSSKISPTVYDWIRDEELKHIYYLLIRYYFSKTDYHRISFYYNKIYNIASVREDPSQCIQVLEKICCYLILSPHGELQSSLLHSILEDENLSKIPEFKLMLKQLVTMEIVKRTSWDICLEEFGNDENMPGGSNFSDDKSGEADLGMRIAEHNILVVSKWYSRITLKRLAELSYLSTVEEVEKQISKMIISKALFAKIDQLLGIVSFQVKKSNDEILDLWAANVDKVVDAVDKVYNKMQIELTSHLAPLRRSFINKNYLEVFSKLLAYLELEMKSSPIDAGNIETRLTSLQNVNDMIRNIGVKKKIVRANDLLLKQDWDGLKAVSKEIRKEYEYLKGNLEVYSKLQRLGGL